MARSVGPYRCSYTHSHAAPLQVRLPSTPTLPTPFGPSAISRVVVPALTWVAARVFVSGWRPRIRHSTARLACACACACVRMSCCLCARGRCAPLGRWPVTGAFSPGRGIPRHWRLVTGKVPQVASEFGVQHSPSKHPQTRHQALTKCTHGQARYRCRQRRAGRTRTRVHGSRHA